MIDLLMWIGIFLVSMLVLIKASDYFTDSAEKIGLWFGMPAFIVGVTIVSIGTSLPELISSIISVLNNSSEIVIGNVLGSNITNIFLVLGITAIIAGKLEIFYELIHVDLPMLMASAFIVGVMLWDGTFTRGEAVICIAGYILYLLYTLSTSKGDKEIKKETKKMMKKKPKIGFKTIFVLIISGFFIFLGAKYTVDSVIQISEMLNIGKEIIAASAVALGTSLPELMVSITAARKGKPEMAVGNVLGSNIFNAFAVMGIPTLFGTLIIPQNMLTFTLPLMLVSMMMISSFLYYFITLDKEITKWEGWILIIFYVFFICKLFNLV